MQYFEPGTAAVDPARYPHKSVIFNPRNTRPSGDVLIGWFDAIPELDTPFIERAVAAIRGGGALLLMARDAATLSGVRDMLHLLFAEGGEA